MFQEKENGTPEKNEGTEFDKEKEEFKSTINAAGRRLVHFILQDEGMMTMEQIKIDYALDYAKRMVKVLFTSASLQEVLHMLEQRDTTTSDHQSE